LLAVLESLNLQTLMPDYLLVVDSSDEYVGIKQQFKFNFEHLKSEKNLTYQRNIALTHLKSFPKDSLVHFFDDDVVLGPDYLELVVHDFIRFPSVTGICARTPGMDWRRANFYKRFFYLDSIHSGRILKSGVNVPFRDNLEIYDVDWLPGCCMSYRLSSIVERKFDETRKGVGWGEDVDFSYQLSLNSTLICDPNLKIIHKMSPANRDSVINQYLKVVLNRFKLRKIPGGRIRLFFILVSIFGEVPLLFGLRLKYYFFNKVRPNR
jgi:GT2 family glycosyltransferase